MAAINVAEHMGICSICGLKDNLQTVLKHFTETHNKQDDHEYASRHGHAIIESLDPEEEEEEEETESTEITVSPLLPSQTTIVESKADNEDLDSITDSGGFTWKHSTTMLLIETRGQLNDKFESGMRKYKAWANVSEKMQEKLGYTIPPSVCDLKWRNIVKSYRKIKERLKQPDHRDVKWRYYEKMDDILGEKPTNASSPNGMVSLTMLEDNDTIAASPQPGTSSSSSCSAKERMTVKNELSHQVTSKKRSAKRRYPYWFEKFETMIEKREAMEAHSRAQHQANVEALLDIERERNANLRRIAAILEQLIKK